MLLSAGMERVSSLIARSRLGESIDPEVLATRAWPAAVGKRIAAVTRAARLLGDTLVVDVDDAVWQSQLGSLSGYILANIARSIGPGRVKRLEFRVRPGRRGPQRAAAPVDEADQIEDPILRGVYRAARKKAAG